jgi:hypothetical protein
MAVLRAMLLALVGLLVLAVAAAWVVPPLLDAGHFRGQIARFASARFGREVRIDGPIQLRLLPEPTLTARGVTIGRGSDTTGLTAAELSLRIAPGPLLGGRVDAREVVLRGAELRLPWPPDPATLTWHTPSWLAAISARIEDGRLRIGRLAVGGINATLATDPYTGSYAALGTATLDGQTWRFSARLSQPGRDGSATVDLALDGQGARQGVSLALSGLLALDGSLNGHIRAAGPDLARLLPAPAAPFRAEGRLTMAGGLVAADDLAIDIGGAPARGAVALRLMPRPRLDIALATGRLALDAWLPVLLRPSGLGLPTSVDISAEAATLAGGTVTGLRGTLDLEEGGAAALHDVRATLPGDATLRLTGRIEQANGATPVRFGGDAALDAPTLRTTLDWLRQAGLLPHLGLPEGVLRSATLAGHVQAEAGRLAADKLTGSIDGAKVSGSLLLHAGERFSLGAVLTADRVDLDPWLGTGAVPPLAAWTHPFAGFDLQLRLTAQRADWRGQAITPLLLDIAAEGGKLAVQQAEAQVVGVHLTASGTIADGGRVSDGKLAVQAAEATPLAGLLPDRLAFLRRGTQTLWRAPLAAEVLAAGPPDRLALQVKANLGDLLIEAQPTLDLPSGAWKGPLTLRHPGAPRLLESLGIAPAPAWLGDGSFALVAQAAGSAGRLAADNFDLTAATLHASGALAFDATGPVPQVTGRVTAETLPLPLPAPGSRDPLSFALLTGWGGAVRLQAGRVLVGQDPLLTDAQAVLALADGVLRIDDLTGKLAGGSFAGSASLEAAASPPRVSLHGAVSGAGVSEPEFGLPLDITGGTLDATVALTATGFAPAAMLATLAGDVTVQAHSGTLRGVALGHARGDMTMAAAQDALAEGATWFDSLQVQGRAERGVVTLRNGGFSTGGGEATVDGQIDLPNRSVDLHLTFRPAGDVAPPIGLRLTGPLDAVRRTPELGDLARWRALHAETATAPASVQ